MPVRDDPEAWQQLRALVDRIAVLDPVARDAVIRGACGEDEEVEEELRNLLSAYDELSTHAPEAVDSIFEPIALDAPRPETARTHVGEFRLAEPLGSGPRGTVYRSERLGGEGAPVVALKLLHRVALDDAGSRAFDAEREKCARLRHEHIAPLLASGRTRDGTPWVATELLDAAPITEACTARTTPLAERLALFVQACAAIRAAHAQLVAHRNIKPSNVVVSRDGVVRVLDFDLGVPLPMVDGVLPDDLPSWPAHAAPEQVRAEPSGIACDVYQLGALLYELLCGRSILRDADLGAAEVEATILNRVPALPSEIAAAMGDDAARRHGYSSGPILAKALRGNLDAIALRALRKEPEARYASVAHLVEDVQRHLRGERPLATAGERKRGWRDWFRRG
jgi:eukaryotic-like serine/threonine-protein kinase